jgi:hypothetical protein
MVQLIGRQKYLQNVTDSNSNLTMSMTQHNQTKELTTWFLRLFYPYFAIFVVLGPSHILVFLSFAWVYK